MILQTENRWKVEYEPRKAATVWILNKAITHSLIKPLGIPQRNKCFFSRSISTRSNFYSITSRISNTNSNTVGLLSYMSKPTVPPVQTLMCESVRLRSLNDMCHDVMQRRNATLKDCKGRNSVCTRNYKCIS